MRSLLLIIAVPIAFLGKCQSTPDSMIREFFGAYSTGKMEKAIDDLYALNPWMIRRNEEIANLKRQLQGAIDIMGDYRGYAMMGSKDILADLVAIDYLVKYDRQPLRFRFMFYRAHKDWIPYSFSFDDSIDEELKDVLRNSYLQP